MEPPASSARDQLLGRALADCLEAFETGASPDPGALLRRHPEFARELERFFAQHAHVDRLAAPLRAARDRAEHFRGTARFAVQRRLGAGAMGVVYQAFDRERGAWVALKVLRRVDPDAIARFKREFRALAEVANP